MYEATIKKRENGTLNDYKENALLTQEIIDQIGEQHDLEIKNVYKNIYLTYNKKIIEFDVLIEAETYTERKRWISVELKDNDVTKVISQAMARRDFVDYSYVVLNSDVKWIVQYLFYVWSEYVKKYKIGFFSNDTFILYSKYIKSQIKINLEENSKS